METAVRSVEGFRLTSPEFIVYAVISFVVVLWCHSKWSSRHFDRLAAKMTGPPAYPIVGAGLEFIGTPERKDDDDDANKTCALVRDVPRDSHANPR